MNDSIIENETPNKAEIIEDEVPNERVGISLLSAIILSFAMAGMLLALYHFYIAEKPVRFALLDVQKITSLIENSARKSIVENLSATDADRQAAQVKFEQRMRGLQDAINKIGDQCNCVLIVKAAVLNTQSKRLKDYTAQTVLAMGLDEAVLAPSVQPAPPPADAASSKATETAPANRVNVPKN